jgi:hypothetical protein
LSLSFLRLSIDVGLTAFFSSFGFSIAGLVSTGFLISFFGFSACGVCFIGFLISGLTSGDLLT